MSNLRLRGRRSDQLRLGRRGLHICFVEAVTTALVRQTLLYHRTLMPRRQFEAACLLVFGGHAVVLSVAVVAVKARLLEGLRLEAAVDWLAALLDLRLHFFGVGGRAIDALARGRQGFLVGVLADDANLLLAA